MSVIESVAKEKKDKRFYFHGKDIRSQKFQKKMKKKAKLTRAILINTAFIVVSILVVWIIVIVSG